MYQDVRYKQLAGARPVDGAYVYGLSFCDHCNEAVQFLESEGFGLRFVYLDRIRGEIRKRVTAELEEVRGEKLIYPILELHGEFYFGFDPTVWKDLLAAKEASSDASAADR
jgi:glutaredoxin